MFPNPFGSVTTRQSLYALSVDMNHEQRPDQIVIVSFEWCPEAQTDEANN